MAGLLSNDHDGPDARTRSLYSVANDSREMGHSFLDLWYCHLAFWSISNQNDLGLFSAKRQVDGI
jgi:hypothetical protein